MLVQHFGKYGKQLFLYAQGIDERPVQAERERQQISKETTFDDDLTLTQCQNSWPRLIDQVWNSLERKQLCARGVSAKLKLKNFQVLQHSKSFKQPCKIRNNWNRCCNSYSLKCIFRNIFNFASLALGCISFPISKISHSFLFGKILRVFQPKECN